MSQRTLAIQIGAVSFQDEGIETVLEILQERGGIDALFLATPPGRAEPEDDKFRVIPSPTTAFQSTTTSGSAATMPPPAKAGSRGTGPRTRQGGPSRRSDSSRPKTQRERLCPDGRELLQSRPTSAELYSRFRDRSPRPTHRNFMPPPSRLSGVVAFRRRRLLQKLYARRHRLL